MRPIEKLMGENPTGYPAMVQQWLPGKAAINNLSPILIHPGDACVCRIRLHRWYF